MNLLFINQFFYPDESATAQLLTDLAEDLVTAGHQVTVLCGQSRYSPGTPLLNGKTQHQGINIRRLKDSGCGRHQIWKRLLDAVHFNIQLQWALRKMNRFDAVIAMTSPPLIAHSALTFCKRHKTPLLLWSQDVYPEIAEQLGVIRHPWLKAYFRRKARQIYSACSKIIVPGCVMKKALEKNGVHPDQLHVLENWSDLSQLQFHPIQQNPFRHSQSWKNDRVLMYSGNVGRAHQMEAMSHFIQQLSTEIPHFHFVLVGDSPHHRMLEASLHQRGLNGISRLPFQPRNRLSEVLGSANVHLVSQDPETLGLVVPSKFYGAMAVGRPVLFLGPKASELGQFIQQDHLGVVLDRRFTNEDLEKCKQTFDITVNSPDRLKTMRIWAENHGNRRLQTQRFLEILH